MLNATEITSHHLQLLWLAQWEDYGNGCGFTVNSWTVGF